MASMDRRAAPGMGAAEWSLLLFLGCLWGASFFFFKVLVGALPPLTVVAGRVGLAAVALNLIARSRPDWRAPDLREWPSFLVLGVLSAAAPFSLIAYGETRITSGLASILNATTPIFTLLVAHALTHDDKLTWNRGLGVAAAFLGVVVVVGPSAFSAIGRQALPGQVACLSAAVLYGFGGVYARRFRGRPLLQVATGQITAAAVAVLPFALLFDRPWTLPPPGAGVLAALLGLALLSTALAFLIYFRILAAAGATNVSLVTLVAPVAAIVLGFLALGERLESRSAVGLLLIALGLVAIDGRLLARFSRKPA